MTRAAQVTQAVSPMRKAGAASNSPPLVDLPAPRNAARDRLDAERWLDEGGSGRGEAVTQ
jgi:hypothetical protein